MKRLRLTVCSIAVALMALSGVVISGQAKAPPSNKAKFTNPLTIDNPYMPLVPGRTLIYDGTEGHKSTHEEFVVTGRTRTIQGVRTRVIHDTNWTNGKLTEDTFDWFAQDDAGNVWYFGEDSAQYKNGKVIGHEGSWEAGVHGASAGIVMEANPQVGDSYQQENAAPVAADAATVISLNESLCVPHGCFSNVLKTKETSSLEPDVVEEKYYAPNVGEIKAVMVQGGSEESTLTTVNK